MKILLDENIDVRFKDYFSSTNHEIYTVRDMHWNGIKNGILLELLKEHDFDCWIVVDKNIPYQQNISKLPCAVVVLDVFRNTLDHIVQLIPDLLMAVESITKNEVIIVPEKGKI